MLMSNINMCSDHWSVKTEPMKTIYEYSESTPANSTLIDQVIVDESFRLDKILFKGQKILSLFQEIKQEIDPKYTDETSAMITFSDDAVCISCWWANRRYPGELEGVLGKIYTIIQKGMPDFSEVSGKINSTIISLGNVRGVAYLLTTPKKGNEDNIQVNQDYNFGVTKLFDSDRKKIYRINGRVWTKEIMDSPQFGFFNNYSPSAVQSGSISNCEYSTPPRGDDKITYISIKTQEIYYRDEDRIVNRHTFLVKAGDKTLHYQEHLSDIKRKLNSYVEKELLDKEFVDLFF